MGTGDGRIKKLASTRKREDIPNIVKDLKAATYEARKKEMPMGLQLASVDQLRAHYAEISAPR